MREYQRSAEHQDLFISMHFLTPTCFRIQVSPDQPQSFRRTPMVAHDIQQAFPITTDENEDRYLVSTGSISVNIKKTPYSVTVSDNSGKMIACIGGGERGNWHQFDALPTGFVIGKDGMMASEIMNLAHNERILGMGERFSGINRRGETIFNYVDDCDGNTSPMTYKPIPFLLSSRGYGIFFNTAVPFKSWIGSQSRTAATFLMEEPVLDYYFFYGPRLSDVITQYTALTGRPALPPRWSFGFWISRNGFNTADEALEVANSFRERELPADVIHFDPQWMGMLADVPLCNFRFDAEKFGDPVTTIEKLRQLNLHLSLWQFPYITEDCDIYAEGKSIGAFVDGYVAGEPPQKIGVIDFSNPKAVEWYQDKLRALLEMGADVIKADFGETSPLNVNYAGYSGAEMHNLYPLLYNQAVFEITEKVKGPGNGLIWGRCAYAGSQRYPIHWSGDADTTWETLPCVLKGGLSLALGGFSFWSHDMGGYLGKPSPELYMRWTQLAMFCSHVRAHGNSPREPWVFGDEALSNFRKYAGLRYRLMPYIYSEAEYASSMGLPLIRPLVLDFDDPVVYTIEDQYLFGRDILVAPVLTEGATERSVYIPQGEWVDYWTETVFTGPRWINSPCPADVMPLFIRMGAVIPMEDGRTYLENRAKQITLHVYPRPCEGEVRNDETQIYDGMSRRAVNVKYSEDEIALSFPEDLPVNEVVTHLGDARKVTETVR